jgi:hypothetical protein
MSIESDTFRRSTGRNTIRVIGSKSDGAKLKIKVDNMKTNNWYKCNTSNGQGMVTDEVTGKTIAVTYDEANASLIAAAPEMYKMLAIIKKAYWDYPRLVATIDEVLKKARGE